MSLFVVLLYVYLLTIVSKSQYCISSNELKLCVSSNGILDSIELIQNNYKFDTAGYTWMGDNNMESKILSVKTYQSNSNSIDVVKEISVYIADTNSYSQNITINETYNIMPDKSTISWHFTILPTTNTSKPWRTSIVTQFNLTNTNNNNDIYYWTMHSGSSDQYFEDVLKMMHNTSNDERLLTQLGAKYITESDIANGREIMSYPLSVFTSKSNNIGISLIYELVNINLIAATLDINSNFQSYKRYYNQLVWRKNTVHFTTFIRMNKGFNWRDSMNWTMTRYPQLFLPYNRSINNARINDIGFGIYSCSSYDYINITNVVKQSGANFNWDASFWFPYMGYDLPPTLNWTSNHGSGEETKCGNFKHGEVTSRDIIGKHYKNMKEYNNITTTAYFNLFEFGENIIWPLDIDSNYSKNNWENSSIFLWENLNDSILYDSKMNIQYTWQNAVLLDPGYDSYKTFLVNQTKEHLISFEDGVFNGYSIDRLDHTILYNFGRDDGITWCGTYCASMMIAWKSPHSAIEEITGLIHERNLVVSNNYQTARMDLLLVTDIIFSEASYSWTDDDNYGNYGNKNHLNAIGLSTMGMPAIMWVYNVDEILNDTDGTHQYFQQRLYMNVNLMAPVYGADHSIVPNEYVQMYYNQYGNLFRVLRGTKWWLNDNTVEIINADQNSKPLINSFRKNINQNIIIVIALGDWNKNQIDINITGHKVQSCQAINVESDGKWMQLNVNNYQIVNITNIIYGCSVIECIPK